MKKITTILSLLLLGSTLCYASNKQFPRDDHQYQTNVDRGFGQYYARSLFHTEKVALTYDDGPDPVTTPKILDLLKQYNVQATFFVLGEKLDNPKVQNVLKRIIQEGHFLASHDWNHLNNNGENRAKFKRDLKRSIVKIEKLYQKYAPGEYHPEMYFRFPFGAYGTSTGYHHFNIMKEISQELYGENCINFVFWDIDTDDWLKQMTGKNVFKNIVANIYGGKGYAHKKKRWGKGFKKVSVTIRNPVGGGVILMHDVHAKNVESTKLFLEYAQKKGIEILPLSEVKEYSYAGKRCELISPL